MDATPPICFTCGQTDEPGSRLNHLEDGRICPTCAERLMQALPSLLPGQGHDDADELAESSEDPLSEVAGKRPTLSAVPAEEPPQPDREGA